MDDYRTLVEAAARRKDGKPILNGSADHASIIVETMFRHSKKHVHILSSELNARVFGRAEVIDQVRIFLADPAHELMVLVENPERVNSKHPLVAEISARHNAQIRVADPFIRENFKSHFIVMDGDSYRFEKNKNEPIAVVLFGDTDGASNLDGVFKEVWESSHEFEAAAA